jgi:hypothetical protein
MRRLTLCLIVVVLLSGCSLPDSASTPFFSDGGSNTAEGPVHDRIALWPLLYHRAPVTSVLWPIGEYVRRSHFRIWPLFEVRKLDKPKREYRVLSPLSQFDFDKQRYHIFPVFWGKNKRDELSHLVLFPLLWHVPGEVTTLLPLFWRSRDGKATTFITPLFGRHWRAEDRHSMWALWPLLRWERNRDRVSRRLLPFYAGARDDDGRWDLVLPLFYRGRDADSTTLVTPLFGHYRETDKRHATWLLPLFYHERDGDKTRLVTPLFGRSYEAEDRHATWLLPFYAGKRDGDRRWRALLPLFYHERDGDKTRLVTPLFGRSYEAEDRRSTWALWPLFRTAQDGDATSTRLLPLFDHKRDGEKTRLITVLFGWNRASEDRRSTWALWPLFRTAQDGDVTTTRALPLFHHKRDGKKTKLFTPLFGWNRESEDRRSTWALWPLFRTALSKDESSTRVLPFYLGARDGEERWDAVPPLFFHKRDARSQRLVTLLFGGYRESADHYSNWLLPLFFHRRNGEKTELLTPLFGRNRESEDRSSTWALWPLFRTARDGNVTTTRALPLFHHRRDGEKTRLITALFGWNRESEDRRSTWALWPLFRTARDGDVTTTRALPLFHHKRDGEKTRLITALFGWNRESDDRRSTWALWPLFRTVQDGDATSTRLLPLFYSGRNSRKTSLVTLLFSRFRKLDAEGNVKETDTWLLGPLARLRRNIDGGGGSHILPLYYRNRDDKKFLSLPWSRGGDEKNGFWSVLGPVLGRSWRGDASRTWLLGPLMWADRSATHTAIHVGLLLWNSEYRGKDDWKWNFALFFNGRKDGEDESLNLGLYWRRKTMQWARLVREGKPFSVKTTNESRGLFPLVRARRKTQNVTSGVSALLADGAQPNTVLDKETVSRNLLWRVWDSKRRTVVDRTGDKPVTNTYTRSRVLWRVVHYEKKNDSVALDILPGITYDSTPGKHKSASFLWRVFRYEWNKDTGTKVHILFIPFGG